MKFPEKSSLAILTVLCTVTAQSAAAVVEKPDLYELSIVHLSDFHSRYEPVSPPSGSLCYDADKCVGGIARVARIVKRYKENQPNALFLNAGDNFQGTLYYDLYRGNITAPFMNDLPHDAMTIGNHDFDDGVSGFASFARQLRAPVVVANIDTSKEPSMKNVYTNSTTIVKGGKRIGIIGVIFSDTDKISKTTGKLKFLDEVETVNAEAKKLKAQGVDIVVVLSHCGIDRDKLMAKECPDINVIVGGHSHILLWSGANSPPSGELAYDKYPIAVTQRDNTNKTVLIVHAGAYTKYVGDLKVVFNERNEIVTWSGNPIYLDRAVKEDPAILEKLRPWKIGVDKVGKVHVGETRVFLNGTCSTGDCSFADFITDVMVDKYAGSANISLNSALNIQNSIPAGEIVYEDIYMTLPYNNTWDLIELAGSDLLKILEENVAVSVSNTSFINYKLLHWSGLKVTYNLKNTNSKVVEVKVRCSQCTEEFEILDLQKRYRIVVASYLLTSAYKTIQKKHRLIVKGETRDVDNLVDYVKRVKVINDVKPGARMIFQ
ncbi:apyrase [Copidosoma floridanum]|uniref:apyrase n=1 Tax=Copidosoma floridanum TaxID=29053 RepID=UPI0006C9D887|nr:apyrase [Copidosoma floridanum]